MKIWDYDHCHECKRFNLRRGKGLNNWRCDLNNGSAQERRDFGNIWATVFMQNHGYDLTDPEIEVIHVRNWKKQKR